MNYVASFSSDANKNFEWIACVFTELVKLSQYSDLAAGSTAGVWYPVLAENFSLVFPPTNYKSKKMLKNLPLLDNAIEL